MEKHDVVKKAQRATWAAAAKAIREKDALSSKGWPKEGKTMRRVYHTFRLLEKACQLAKVAAAQAGLPMGQWLEAAIADRILKDARCRESEREKKASE